MARVSSSELNDKQAVVIAAKLSTVCGAESFSVSALCQFLLTYAKLQFQETLTVLNAINFTKPEPFALLRLAYALLHYSREAYEYGKIPKAEAEVKVIKVTADTAAKSPKITLTMLVVTSPLAGRVISKQITLHEAVTLQKRVYCGRSRAFYGRSLLEFVGCRMKAKLFGNTVDKLFADQEIRKMNKKLCADRVRADDECRQALNCALCKKRRTECRLATKT